MEFLCQTSKFRLTLRRRRYFAKNAQGVGTNPSWFLPSRLIFFYKNIFPGYVFRVEESNGDNCMTLKIKFKNLWNFLSSVASMTRIWSRCRFLHFGGRVCQQCETKSRDLDGWALKLGSHTIIVWSFFSSGCIYAAILFLGSILTFSRSRISDKLKLITWPSWLTLKWGSNTFRVSGCEHHTDMIFVSILTSSFLRCRNCWSNLLISNVWPWNWRWYTFFTCPCSSPAICLLRTRS